MAKKSKKRAAEPSREERVRQEILAAKKHGIDPPRQIPRGERFTVEGMSRPPSALARAAAIAEFQRAHNADVVEALAAPASKPVRDIVRRHVGGNLEPVFSKLEADIDRLTRGGSPARMRSVGDTLNLLKRLGFDTARTEALTRKLDDIRFGGVDYVPSKKGVPGGAHKRP